MTTTIRKTFSKMTAKAAAILPAFLVAVSLSAAQPDGFNDGIDGTDPNFVTASLLVMSPGVLLEGGAIWR
ncbi:MAG: hypothetical protein IJI54_01670 [Kiritimatiellae bacterium]|nr:hypothetical protein [Kiritimatiellia bacterium]